MLPTIQILIDNLRFFFSFVKIKGVKKFKSKLKLFHLSFYNQV